MDEDRSLVSRRTAIKSGAVALTTGVIGTGAVLYSSRPALAVTVDTWDAGEDLAITTQDGTVDEVVVDPTVTVDYANLEPDREIEFGMTVREADDINNNAGQGYPSTGEFILEGRSGTFTEDLSPAIDLVVRASFDEEVLFADEPGGSNTTTLDVEFSAEVLDQPALDPIEHTDSFDLTVNNAAPEASVDASASTSVSSEDEV